MEFTRLLLGFLLTAFSFFFIAESQTQQILSAYEMLENFDFPKGILPKGVEGYSLRNDGSFDVFLGDYCELKVSGNYLLRYKRKISGMAEIGRLKNLDGVSVKIFFLWFAISEVTRSGDELNFCVGPFSAAFSVSNFEVCPRCSDEFSSHEQKLVLDDS